MSTINLAAHGLTAGQRVVFSNIAPAGTGLEADIVYTVLAAGLTTDAFQVSETGSEDDPLTLTGNVTSADMAVIPETTTSDPDSAAYIAISDPADVQAPPVVLTQPDVPTATSTTVDGLIRLHIELPTYPDAAQRIRALEVQVTHAFDGADPIWLAAQVFAMPVGSQTMSIPALALTRYNVRSRAQDIFGNYSEFSTVKDITTEAGFDSRNPADGSVSEVTIKDGAVTADKIYGKSIEAKHLASVIVLASLLQTAPSGRRVEMDSFGIRLWGLEGGNEVLLVNIPTNGEAVYVKGDVTASSFISNTAATLYGTNTFPAASVTTLYGGIAAPSNTPTLTQTVDQLALGSTPTGSSTAAGIAWDATGGVSGTGSYWIAADPTATGNYVAHEYNADGTYRRSISRTGSTATYTDTIGSTSHVADTTDATSGTTMSQIATPLTMPRDGTITKVSAYLAGYDGACDVQMHLWNTSGTRYSGGYSATFSAASRTFSNGNDVRYEKTLTTPRTLTSGTSFWAGFVRTSSADGFFWSKNDGTGYTTHRGDGLTGDFTSDSADTNSKPNIYVTYEYTVNTVKETYGNIGIATDGTYVYTLDKNGVVWKYNRSTLAWVANSAVLSLTGVKANNGMFYDATAGRLIITHASGTTGTDHVKFSVVNPTSLAIESTATDAVMFAVNGNTMTFRGGVRLADPLNSNTVMYWVAMGGGSTWPFQQSDGQAPANYATRAFGEGYNSGGVLHDGTQFRGWSPSNPTKVTTFSNWDWASGGDVFWVGYSWYDSNATGGTHETTCGPRSSITMARRMKLIVTNASIPAGGTDDPDKVRVYALQSGSNFSAGGGKWQDEGTGTSRTLTTYNSGGTADPTVNGFGTGSAAEMKSNVVGWSLKGDGNIVIQDGGPGLKIGDDSLLTDVDIADTMGIYGQQNAANGGIVFGSGHDTNLYRASANVLKTDDQMHLASGALLRYVPSGTAGTAVLNGVAGQTSDQTVELTGVPANGAVFAEVVMGVRDSTGANISLTPLHYDGTPAALCYTSGVASKGGWHTGIMVQLGGTNGRQMKWRTSATTNVAVYLYLSGWWVAT